MLPEFNPLTLPTADIPAAISKLAAWQSQLAARLMQIPAAEIHAGGSLLTAAEMAKRLNVHESAVRTMEREGKIPGVRIGRYVRFRAEEVEAAFESRLTKLSA